MVRGRGHVGSRTLSPVSALRVDAGGVIDRGQQLSRRHLGLLGLGLAVGAVGCSATRATSSARQPPQVPATPPSSAPASASPTPTLRQSAAPTDGRSALPRIVRWQPSPNDVQPQVKLRAVRLIEAIGSWTVAGRTAAADRVAALGEDRRLVRHASPLLGAAGQAVLAVIDAQYGGILPDAASVLVVCRQWRAMGGDVTPGGSTVDVRLIRSADGWRVTAIHPAQPGHPQPTLSPLVKAVLASHRIDLPPASIADLKSGQVHDSVLTALLHLGPDLPHLGQRHPLRPPDPRLRNQPAQ